MRKQIKWNFNNEINNKKNNNIIIHINLVLIQGIISRVGNALNEKSI